MTLRVETAGAPQIPSARGTKSACGRRASASRHVSLRTSRNGSSDHHQLHSDWWIGSSRFWRRRSYLSIP